MTVPDQDPAAASTAKDSPTRTAPADPIEQLAQGPGAEWEYTFDGPSGRMHALERVFVVGGRGFVIQWRTPDAQWQANLSRFGVIVDSFRAPAER